MLRVYRLQGEPLTAGAMRAMERYLAGRKDHQGHRYHPRDFGLDEAKVRRAFTRDVSAQAGTPVDQSAISPEVPAFAETTRAAYS